MGGWVGQGWVGHRHWGRGQVDEGGRAAEGACGSGRDGAGAGQGRAR